MVGVAATRFFLVPNLPLPLRPTDEKPERVVCPFCDSDRVDELRRNGAHNQLSVFRCRVCHGEWPELDRKNDDSSQTDT